jgi:DNA-binding XRE family transcriptional regulator
MIKNKLKEIRMKEFMLNKKEFAKYLEIAERQYNRYENAIQQPSLETALYIAKKINKTVDDLWEIV